VRYFVGRTETIQGLLLGRFSRKPSFPGSYNTRLVVFRGIERSKGIGFDDLPIYIFLVIVKPQIIHKIYPTWLNSNG
jgi:hypothetical protein